MQYGDVYTSFQLPQKSLGSRSCTNSVYQLSLRFFELLGMSLWKASLRIISDGSSYTMLCCSLGKLHVLTDAIDDDRIILSNVHFFHGLKFSWVGTNPQRQPKFYPTKLSSYNVIPYQLDITLPFCRQLMTPTM